MILDFEHEEELPDDQVRLCVACTVSPPVGPLPISHLAEHARRFKTWSRRQRPSTASSTRATS